MNFCFIIVLHFIGDVVFQTEAMRYRKSFDPFFLALHAFCYGLCLLPAGVEFALINAVFHGAVDMASSQITSDCWIRKDWPRFYFTILVDQTAHLSILYLTYKAIL